MLNKDEFVKTMKKLEEVANYRDELAAISRKYWCGDFWDYPSTDDTCIDLLNHIFGLETDVYGSDIDYFVTELNFGKDWKPGMIEDDGVDIDLSSAEKLYDYITKDREDKNDGIK